MRRIGKERHIPFMRGLLLKSMSKVIQKVFPCLLIGGIIALLSCTSKKSVEDARRVSELNQRFGNRYAFKVKDDIYLIARAQTGTPPQLDEATSIYTTFWSATNGSIPRPTSYVYLNLYDRAGTFQFQLFYDPREKTIKRSTTEFY
jgi:hypothetical protein